MFFVSHDLVPVGERRLRAASVFQDGFVGLENMLGDFGSAALQGELQGKEREMRSSGWESSEAAAAARLVNQKRGPNAEG